MTTSTKYDPLFDYIWNILEEEVDALLADRSELDPEQVVEEVREHAHQAVDAWAEEWAEEEPEARIRAIVDEHWTGGDC